MKVLSAIGPVALVALVALIALAACGRSSGRDRFDFARMRVQPRYALYESSGVFADHQTMQQAPAGTVSREAAADTAMPISNAVLARGERQYGIYCAVCHGAGAFGGSVVAENMGAPRPPSLRSAAARTWPATYVFDVATHGKGRMPPYAPQLSASDRWAVAVYVQHLQHTAMLTAGQRDDSARADRIRAIDSALATERRK